jgi:hypothetical protein
MSNQFSVSDCTIIAYKDGEKICRPSISTAVGDYDDVGEGLLRFSYRTSYIDSDVLSDHSRSEISLI